MPPSIDPAAKPNRIRKLLLLGFATVVAAFLLGSLAIALAGLRDHLGHSDVALVLGNKVNPDGTPSARLRARLDRTVELYRAGYFPEIITSGGVGKEGHDEAAVMRDYLVTQGIPAGRILVDSTGLNTHASALATRQLAATHHWQSVMVVTQYFHVPRSRLAVQKAGFAPVYGAHAHYFEARDLYSIPREFLGYLTYLLRPV